MLNSLLVYLQKYIDQRGGLALGREVSLLVKILQFTLNRLFKRDFVISDIWGVKHKYSYNDSMGFKTALGVYELEEQIFFYNTLTGYGKARVIVDVGSAVGTFTSLFAKCSPDATILSFEPNPFSVKYQREQHELNAFNDRIKVFNIGLGEKHEKLKFNYRDGIQGAMWGRISNNTGDIEVEVSTFDDVASQLEIEALDLVKMDIEGYELPALRGMRNSLTQFRPVVLCEMSLSFMVLTPGNRYLDTMNFIDELNYDVFIIKHGRLVRYTWPEARILNFILIPRNAVSGYSGYLRSIANE